MCPAIDTIVTGINATFGEPGDIAIFEASTADILEGAVPVQKLARGLEQ